MREVNRIKQALEWRAFGVCTALGDKLGIPGKYIRMFFIYASFMTIGSPLILYFILWFWMKLKDYVRTERTAVWDF